MKFDIDYFAKLARVNLGDHKEKLCQDLEHIIDMIERLPDVGEDPLILDENYSMEFRKDEITKSLTREEVLMNAKEVQAGCVVVPKIVE